MIKFFWNVVDGRAARPVWETDPLRHPDIAAMNQRELGDLPIVPARHERMAQGAVACITVSAACGRMAGAV